MAKDRINGGETASTSFHRQDQENAADQRGQMPKAPHYGTRPRPQILGEIGAKVMAMDHDRGAPFDDRSADDHRQALLPAAGRAEGEDVRVLDLIQRQPSLGNQPQGRSLSMGLHRDVIPPRH